MLDIDEYIKKYRQPYNPDFKPAPIQQTQTSSKSIDDFVKDYTANRKRTTPAVTTTTPKSEPLKTTTVEPITVTKKDYFKDSKANAEANKAPTGSNAWSGMRVQNQIIPQAKDFTPKPVKQDSDKETVKKGIAADWKNIWDGISQRFLGTASMFFTNPVANSANNQLLGGIGGKIAEITTGDKTASYQGASEQAYKELKAEQLTPEYKKEQENRQAAIDKAANIVDKWAEKNKATSTISAGLGGLEQGTKNLVKGLDGALYKDELFGIKTYDSGGVLSKGYQQAAQDNKGLEKLLGDLTYSMGNMAPTMLIGSIAGSPGLGAALMGLGSAQGNYEERRKQGYDHTSSLTYGVLTGASEGALQYFIGSIPGLGTKSAGGALIKSPIARKLVSVVDDVFKLSSKSPVVQGLVKTAINSAVDISGEALEEGLQEYIYAGLNKLIFDEDVSYFGKGGLLESSAYSAFLGALTAGILGVPGNINTNSIFKKEARSKELQAEVDKFKQRVKEQVSISENPGTQTPEQIAKYNAALQQSIAEETDSAMKVKLQQALDEYNALYAPAEISTKTPQIGDNALGVQVDAQRQLDATTPTAQAENSAETQPITQAQTTDNIFDLGLTQNTAEPMAVAELTADENNLVQMAKAKFNREVIITDNLPGNAEGMFDKGKIYVGRNADNVYYVFGHELTHSLEVGKDNQKAYNRLSRYVADTVIGRKNMQAEIEATKQRYAEIKPDMTNGEAYTEVIAKATGKYLFTDADAIAKIVRTDRSLASKIVQFLRETATRLAGTKEQKAVLKAIDLYRAALKQASTTENGKTQFAADSTTRNNATSSAKFISKNITNKMTRATKKEYEGFRLDSTGMSLYDNYLEDKGSQYMAKKYGTMAEIVEMPPVEYIVRTAKQVFTAKNGYGKGITFETQLEYLMDSDSEWNDIERYSKLMGNGTKFYLPIMNLSKNSQSQEGRHRAMAAYLNNIDVMPVLLIQDIPKEGATAKYSIPEDYAMQHRPTESGAIASDISTNGEYMPKDVYTHPEWYFQTIGNSDFNRASRESWAVIRRIKGNPNAKVTIYRATVKNEFNSGDWVTLSPTYAKIHAERANENKRESDLQSKVFSKQVTAKDIQFAGDDINEFGYYPQTDAPKYSIPEDKAPKTQRDKDSEEVKKEKQQRLERLTTILLKYSDKYEKGHDARVAEVDKLYSEGYKLVYGKNDSDISKSEPEPDKMQKVRDARGQTPGFIVSETNSNMYLSEEKITYKGKEYPRYRMAKYKDGKYRIYEADESTGSIRYEDRIIATDTTPTKAIKKLEVFINNSGMIIRAWDKSERIDEYIKGQEKALQQYTDDYNSSTTDSAKSLYSDLIAKTKSEITRLKNEQSKLRQSAEPDKVYTEEKIPPIIETDGSLPMKSTKRASRKAEGGLTAEEIEKNAKKKEDEKKSREDKAKAKKEEKERYANRKPDEVFFDDLLKDTDYSRADKKSVKEFYSEYFGQIKDILWTDIVRGEFVEGEYNEDAITLAKKIATDLSEHILEENDYYTGNMLDDIGGITWDVSEKDIAEIKRAYGTNIKSLVDQLRSRGLEWRRNSGVGSDTAEVANMIISVNSDAFGGDNRPGTITADEVVRYLLGYSENWGEQSGRYYNPIEEGELDGEKYIESMAEKIYEEAAKQVESEIKEAKESKQKETEKSKKTPEEVKAIIDKGIEESGYKEPVTQEQLDNKQLIPNKIKKDGKSVTVRGVFNTSLHMGLKNSETYPDIIDKTIVNGTGTYTPESNKKTLDAAQKKIDRLGYDGALSEWEYKVDNDMRIRDIDVATAELLYKAAIEGNQGDIARKLLSEIAMIGTENGQAIQIISLFNKLNGEAHLITAQKIADRLNKQTEEQRKKQDKEPIEIPDNLAEKVRKAKTPAEKDAAFMEIKQDMYDQLPYGTWWERWNAWRYISMLGNFKTNIKNIGGNMGMLPLVAAKNLQLISMEKVANDKRLAQLKNIQAQMSKVKTTAELVELLGKANREDTGYAERLTKQLKDAGELFEASILKTEMLNLKKQIDDGIGIYRTRAFHKSKSAHDFAVEDFKARAKSVMSGSSKYMGIPNSEFNDRRIFKFGLFEGARKLTNKPLEYGDKIFVNHYYVNALASFLDANNVDIDAVRQAGEAIAKGEIPADENAAKMVNLAREYATQEAREATFRDFSLITETIVEFRDAKTVATKHGTERTLKQSEKIARRIAVDSVLPFVGTLVNITRRGAWEYNVGGLAKTILFDTNKVKTGEMSATTYLNKVAKGTTGSAVVLMGYLLGAAGLIVGRLPEDENERDLAKTAGQQAYSLIIGNNSYTIDWIAPFCIPLFLGVELSNLKKSGATQFKDYYQAGMNILSPLFELTLLKSVTDVVKAVKYENEPAQMFGVGVSTLGLNYLAQGTPTLFGQISRTITKEQKTSVVDEGNPFTRDQQFFVQKIMGKLFMNQNKQDYVNMFGETKDTGNVAQRIASNFLLPWYSSKLKDDNTIKGMISLEKEKTDGLGTNTIPKIPSASLPGVGDYKNKTYQLTADQLTELKKQVGVAQKQAADAFIAANKKVNLKYQYATGTSKNAYAESFVTFSSVNNKSKGKYSDEDLKVKALDNLMGKAYDDAVIAFIKAHKDLVLKK
jgi:hypothetical protein